MNTPVTPYGTLPPASTPSTRKPMSLPRLTAIPSGCAFNPRCPRVFDRCRSERPDLLPAGATRAACWLHAPALRAAA